MSVILLDHLLSPHDPCHPGAERARGTPGGTAGTSQRQPPVPDGDLPQETLGRFHRVVVLSGQTNQRQRFDGSRF